VDARVEEIVGAVEPVEGAADAIAR